MLVYNKPFIIQYARYEHKDRCICVVTIRHNTFFKNCTLTRGFHVAVLHNTSRHKLLCDVFQQSLLIFLGQTELVVGGCNKEVSLMIVMQLTGTLRCPVEW